MSFTRRFFGRKWVAKPRSNVINKSMENYREQVRKGMHNHKILSSEVTNYNWKHKGTLRLYSIPSQSVESHIETDYYRAAIEKHNPDTVFFQIDSNIFYNKTHSLESDDAALTSQNTENTQKRVLPNRYPQKLEDLIFDYDAADLYLSKFYEKQRAEGKNTQADFSEILEQKPELDQKDVANIYQGYTFDEVYFKNLPPQMLDKIHEYRNAFQGILTKEEVRNHPKMKELKQVHDIIELCRELIWGAMIDHLHYDMYNHLMRSMINQHNIVLGEYPEPMYRKYLDSTIPYKKLKWMYKEIMTKLQDEEYDDIRGSPQIHNLTNIAALAEFPEYFIRPKSLYMASAIKELLEQDKKVVAFVGSSHFAEVRERLRDNMYYRNLNLNKFLAQGIKPSNDTGIERVKKQALLDNLLDSYPYLEEHITNPFCWVNEDPTQIAPNEMNIYKTEFLQTFTKYNNQKKEVLKYDKNELEKIQDFYQDQEQDKRKEKLEKARQM